MFVREMRLSAGNKLAAIVLGAVLLGVVGIFLAFGFVLLLGLTVAGLLLGTGAAVYRRVTGRTQPTRVVEPHHGLDPTREVSPPPPPPSSRAP